MKSDEVRSHRLNYLLRAYRNNPNENALYARAFAMNVSPATAQEYTKTVIAQANKMKPLT